MSPLQIRWSPHELSSFLDGEGFILQVHGVFTRIRSGDTAVASYSGALGSTLLSTAAARTGGDSWLDLLRMAALVYGEETLRVLASIYKSAASPPTAGWISMRSADSAAAPDSSTSTSRRASSRGLGYFYSTSWVATRLKGNSEHILQDDPSIREEVLDSRIGGSVPRVLRFFLWIFRDILAKTSDGPSARVYSST
jgi:hypothetical protein